MADLGERVASLEAIMPRLETKVDSLSTNVQTLVDAHNRQTGAAKLAALIGTTILTIGGAVLGYKSGSH